MVLIRDYNREYRDNGKENGNYYSIMGYIWGSIGVILGLYRDNGATIMGI